MMYLLLSCILAVFYFSKIINSEDEWKLFWKYEFDNKQLDPNQWLVDDEPEELCAGTSS